MFSTYEPEDVTLLLKDISGLVAPQPAAEREALIQSGVHYCEMLPLEYRPSALYLKTYARALALYAGLTARAVAAVAERIYREKGGDAVLVSLARAGTPVGVLIRRWLRSRRGVDVPHYAVSIIRGRGIDGNAMAYILSHHAPQAIQFVDGWTGKGAIQRQLDEAMADWPGVDPGLAVLSDPSGVARLRGTYDDFLIPSACLNATVSGLISRTFLRGDIIGPGDFHGAAFYRELMDEDVTYDFIRAVEAAFPDEAPGPEPELSGEAARDEVEAIRRAYGVRDVNLVKPGIGETTRVLLRRVPGRVLVHSLDDAEHLGHIYQLAAEKGVPVEVYPFRRYRACGLIRELADT